MNKHKETKPGAQEVRENSVGWMLKTLCGRLDGEMTKALKPLGLNLSQFAVLMALMEKEGLTQTEIGGKMTMPGYATTRCIDALEVMHYVERRKDERSRRSYRIYLTEQGRAVSPLLFKTVGKINEALLSPLDASGQRQFTALLQKIL
ncbi:MAG: MarR family transcriptional regulator [Pseudomonadota bacterium]|nr:MarR family transcriptional regulator [Pseudomonadota bacterium]